MLTLEQCEQLEKWGLPQVGFSNWYVDKSPNEKPIWLRYDNPTNVEVESQYRIKCPDLEPLLDFATDWINKKHPNDKYGGQLPGIWASKGVAVYKGRIHSNPDTCKAVYHLMEELDV